MSYRAFVLILALSFIPLAGFTQDEPRYTLGVTRLLNWFDDIDGILSRISSKEKLKRIYRQLGYVGEDLDNIGLNKYLLSRKLFILASKEKKTKSTVQQEAILREIRVDISSISENFNRMAGRLESVKSDVSQTDQVQVEQILQTVRYKIQGKRGVIGKIEQHLFDATPKNLPKIIEETNKSQKIVELTSKKIREAKLKIKKKLEQLEKKNESVMLVPQLPTKEESWWL